MRTRHVITDSEGFLRGPFLTLLCLIIWLPLPLGSNRIWASMLFVAVTLAATFTCLLQHYRYNKRLPTSLLKAKYAVLCLIGAQLYVLCQSLFGLSIYPAETYTTLLEGIGLTVFFALALIAINSQKRLSIVLWTFVVSGTFQALFGSWMTLSGAESLLLIKKEAYIGTATGTFINRNHLAGYLVLCISMGLALMLANISQKPYTSIKEMTRRLLAALLSKKIILRVCIAIMVIALVLTHSRMGNTSFFVALLLASLIYLIVQRFKRNAILLFASLMLIDLFIVGAFFGVDKVVDRLNETSLATEDRVSINHLNTLAFSDYAILGSGAGTYETLFPNYRFEELQAYYDYAHNDYLQFLIERGIFGCIPLLIFFFLSFFTAVIALKQRRQILTKCTSLGCIMSLTALLLHSTVDFNLYILANSASFMLVFALAWISRYLPSEPKSGKAVH